MVAPIPKLRAQRLALKGGHRGAGAPPAPKSSEKSEAVRTWVHGKKVKAEAPAAVAGNTPGISKPRPFDPYTSTDIAGPKNEVPLDADLAAKKPLKGLEVAVLVESQFVPQELALYATRFKAYGAKVNFVSRLWDQPKLEFHSRYDSDIVPELRSMTVDKDIKSVDLSSGKVAAVIQSVHTQQRLLYDNGIMGSADAVHATAEAPAVKLVEAALKDPKVVVGTFGHGGEVLAPLASLVKGAKFTASPGSVIHMVNTGLEYVPPADKNNWTLHTVVEKDRGLNLVSATSILHGGNEKFVDVIARTVMEVRAAKP